MTLEDKVRDIFNYCNAMCVDECCTEQCCLNYLCKKYIPSEGIDGICDMYDTFNSLGEDIINKMHLCISSRYPHLKVKYTNELLIHIQQTEGSDWIDLRSAEDVDLKAGEYNAISLGVCMQLPEGYEAHIRPRSSTFNRWGLIMACSGIIDNSYCGDNDVWNFGAFATHDTHISFNDRICQFRIVKKQPTLNIESVEQLGNPDRGGFGSTGVK